MRGDLVKGYMGSFKGRMALSGSASVVGAAIAAVVSKVGPPRTRHHHHLAVGGGPRLASKAFRGRVRHRVSRSGSNSTASWPCLAPERARSRQRFVRCCLRVPHQARRRRGVPE